MIFCCMALAGCMREDIIDDGNVDYDYLQECLWVPSYFPEDLENIPELAKYSELPAYFTDNSVVIMRYDGDKLSYFVEYKYDIDHANRVMVISNTNIRYSVRIHNLGSHHMTLYFKDDPESYVIYLRQELPEYLTE